MQVARTSTRRAGVASALIVVGGLGFISAVGVYSMVPATKAVRPAQPQEIGAVLILAGIDPESLAAAGFSGTDCDAIFDNAQVYCLQSDRMTDFSLAHKAVNEAKARAVKPPVQGQGDLPTVAQAQGTLDDLREAAFTFLMTGRNPDKTEVLRKIRANKQTWKISEPYLAIDRTDAQWLALRGALAAQRFAARKGIELAQAPAAVIAEADANQTVALAKIDFASNLAGVKQAWDSHTHPQ